MRKLAVLAAALAAGMAGLLPSGGKQMQVQQDGTNVQENRVSNSKGNSATPLRASKQAQTNDVKIMPGGGRPVVYTSGYFGGLRKKKIKYHTQTKLNKHNGNQGRKG